MRIFGETMVLLLPRNGTKEGGFPLSDASAEKQAKEREESGKNGLKFVTK